MKILWTDGSADPNPGPGGWAVIEEIPNLPKNTQDDEWRPARIGRDAHTTNIRMEGTAIREAIKYGVEAGESVEIHTDSEFWVNVLTKWAPAWKRNGWVKKTGPIKNLDLVQELYELYNSYDVKILWTRGHVGTVLNELADEWATRARLGETL